MVRCITLETVEREIARIEGWVQQSKDEAWIPVSTECARDLLQDVSLLIWELESSWPDAMRWRPEDGCDVFPTGA